MDGQDWLLIGDLLGIMLNSYVLASTRHRWYRAFAALALTVSIMALVVNVTRRMSIGD